MHHYIFFNFSIVAYLLSSILYIIFALSKKNILKIISDLTFILGILLILTGITIYSFEASRFPLSNTYETLMLWTGLLSISFFIIVFFDKNRIILSAISIILIVIISLSSFFDKHPSPLMPALKSNWLTLHVLFSFIAYTGFLLSFITATLFFIIKNEEYKKKLEIFTYKSVIFGYPFLTLGILTGAVWANQAWGTYWQWDPKETWSLITWIVYGIYLHTKITYKVTEKKSCIFAIIGFLCILFTYFGVNYFLPSLHSYK